MSLLLRVAVVVCQPCLLHCRLGSWNRADVLGITMKEVTKSLPPEIAGVTVELLCEQGLKVVEGPFVLSCGQVDFLAWCT